jgi:hypothetical protein
MSEHGPGIFGLVSWASLYVLGLFTMQSWSFLMGGIAALATGVYYGAKAVGVIRGIIRDIKKDEDDEE